MTLASDAARLLAAYPRIYFACHARHRRDPTTARVISEHQGSILDHLDSVEPTAVSELAHHMGVTVGTMSVNLNRLEAGGYVLRTRGAEDRRRVLVRLTDAGDRMKRARTVLEPRRVVELLKRLSPGDRTRALEGLELLADAATVGIPTNPIEEEAATGSSQP